MSALVRPKTADDDAWVAALLTERWAGPQVVSRGRVHDATALPALVAVRAGRPAGLLTYDVDDAGCEVVTLDATEPHAGAGTALLAALVETLPRSCRRLWLITSNDNLDALRFYQRRHFALVAVHRDAITEARRRFKPSIPDLGSHGIPIRDELELERWR